MPQTVFSVALLDRATAGSALAKVGAIVLTKNALRTRAWE